METSGGSLLGDRLEELKSELEEYYSAILEKSPIIPDIPEALLLYEICEEMGLPLVEGGVLDQPNIWLEEYGICKRKKQLYEQLNKEQGKQKSVVAKNASENEDNFDFKFAQDL